MTVSADASVSPGIPVGDTSIPPEVSADASVPDAAIPAIPTQVKLCTKCKKVKPLSGGYYKAGEYWQKFCKICHNNSRIEYKGVLYKKCTLCDKIKNNASFIDEKIYKNCKTCRDESKTNYDMYIYNPKISIDIDQYIINGGGDVYDADTLECLTDFDYC